MDFTLNDLKAEYVRLLNQKEFDWKRDKPAEEIADRMINAINDSRYPSDWLRQNKTLKEACLRFGIKKSGELREFVKSSFEAIA